MTTNRTKQEQTIIWSILLGVLGFTISLLFISHRTTALDGELAVHISRKTIYQESKSNPVDTLHLSLPRRYAQYVKKATNNKQIRAIQIGDQLQSDSAYTKTSKLINDLIFVSVDSLFLNNRIDALDQEFLADLKKVTRKKNFFINNNPRVLVWMLLISIAIGVSFCLVPIFVGATYKYCTGLNKSTVFWNIALAVTIILLLVLPQVIPESFGSKSFIRPVDIEPNFGTGYQVFPLRYGATAPYIGAIMWLVLILSLNSKISYLHRHAASTLVGKIQDYRKEFESYFIVIAIFIAYTILCTNVLLDVLNGLVNSESPYKLFPTEFSFVNGLSQTFFLGLIYAMVNLNFTNITKDLKKDFSEEVSAQEYFVKGKSFLDYFKIIISILAPLLGGGLHDLISSIISST